MKAFQTIAKEIVAANIDMDYVKECGYTKVSEVYQAEHGYAGLNANACRSYLQGLPGVCTVPFWNNEILDLLAAEGWKSDSEDEQTGLIDRYWLAVGNQFCKFIQKENK